MFGKYKHTLDPKGRLFVPAKLREELGSAFYVARSLDPCLTVYTEEEWQRIGCAVVQGPRPAHVLCQRRAL